MSSGWCYGHKTVLLHRHIQGDTLYMCNPSGVNGKLYVEVTYKDLMLYGEAMKWTAAPQPPGTTKAKAFDNFSPSRSEDDTD